MGRMNSTKINMYFWQPPTLDKHNGQPLTKANTCKETRRDKKKRRHILTAVHRFNQRKLYPGYARNQMNMTDQNADVYVCVSVCMCKIEPSVYFSIYGNIFGGNSINTVVFTMNEPIHINITLSRLYVYTVHYLPHTKSLCTVFFPPILLLHNIPCNMVYFIY